MYIHMLISKKRCPGRKTEPVKPGKQNNNVYGIIHEEPKKACCGAYLLSLYAGGKYMDMMNNKPFADTGLTPAAKQFIQTVQETLPGLLA